MNLKCLENFLGHVERHQRGTGSISIFENGRETYTRDFGRLQLPVAEQKNRRYQVGSISKTFTATLVLHLVQHGRLKLSDTLDSFFPKISNASAITIEHMLGHVSGLSEYLVNNNEAWLLREQKKLDIIDFIKKSQPLFPPGERQQYSNTAYYLLKEIVETIHGEPYFKVLNEAIISKTGLPDTYSAQQAPRLVHKPYEYANGWTEMEDFEFSNVIGVGDLVSTPAALNSFLQLLFGGKIIDPEWVDYMRPLPSESSAEPIFGKGLMTISGAGTPFTGHCGDTYGTHSVMVRNEALDCGVAFSLNGTTYSPLVFFDQIVSALLRPDFRLPEFSNRLSFSRTVLERYAGFYTCPEFPVQFSFFVRDNGLFAQGTGQPVYALSSSEPDIFEYEIGGFTFHFNPDAGTMAFSFANGKFVFHKAGREEEEKT